MKLFSKVFLVSLIFGFAFSVNPAQKVKAYSPIIAVCSNDLAAWWPMTDTIKQKIDVRDDNLVLDAIAFHAMTFNGRNDQITAQLIRRDQGVVATGNGTVGTDPSWIYVTMSHVYIPRGVYFLQIGSSTQDGAAWHYTNNGNCYVDGFMQVNNSSNTDHDAAFAVYAYHYTSSTTNNPASAPPTSASQSAPSSSSSSASTPSVSSRDLKSSWTPPTDADILKMANSGQGGVGLWGGLGAMLGLPIFGMIFSFVGFLLFIGFIILIIYLLTRKNAKPAPSKTASQPPPESGEKDKK